MALTHDLLWKFDAHKADGTKHTFSASKAFDPTDWDDARDAAIFFTFQNKDYLAADGWHIAKPETIQVYRIQKLSDTDLA